MEYEFEAVNRVAGLDFVVSVSPEVVDQGAEFEDYAAQYQRRATERFAEAHDVQAKDESGEYEEYPVLFHVHLLPPETSALSDEELDESPYDSRASLEYDQMRRKIGDMVADFEDTIVVFEDGGTTGTWDVDPVVQLVSVKLD